MYCVCIEGGGGEESGEVVVRTVAHNSIILILVLRVFFLWRVCLTHGRAVCGWPGRGYGVSPAVAPHYGRQLSREARHDALDVRGAGGTRQDGRAAVALEV